MDIVLLRGLIREKRHWNDIPERLQAKIPEANLIFLDLPGAGERYKEKFPVNIKSLISDLHNKLEQKATSKERAIVGISLGGMITFNWIKNYPLDFQKSIIINSSARNLSPIHKRFNLKEYERLKDIVLSMEPSERERVIIDLTCNCIGEEDRERISKKYGDFYTEYPMSKANVIRQLLVGAKMKAPKFEHNMLICSGEKDNLVSSECSKALAKFYNAKTHFHSEAGHDLSLDCPDWLCDNIANFLQG